MMVKNAKKISLQSRLLHFVMAWVAQDTDVYSLFICINRVEGGLNCLGSVVYDDDDDDDDDDSGDGDGDGDCDR